MTRTRSLVALALLAAACTPAVRDGAASAPEVRVVSAVERVTTTTYRPGGSLQTFVPAVAAVEEGGECEILNDRGRPLYLLSFPSRAASVRNVSIGYDATGQPLRYSDARGDLRMERTGPQTVLTLNFQEGVAHGINHVTGEPVVRTQGTLTDAMDAPHLGNPRRMMEMVRTRCGAP